MLQRKKEIIETHSRSTTDGRETCMTYTRKLRRYPIGAELIGAKETHFRVWAPKATHVDVVLEESAAKMRTAPFIRSNAKTTDIFPDRPKPALATAIDFVLITPNIFIPIQRRASSPMARTVRRVLSIQQSFTGPIQIGQV